MPPFNYLPSTHNPAPIPEIPDGVLEQSQLYLYAKHSLGSPHRDDRERHFVVYVVSQLIDD